MKFSILEAIYVITDIKSNLISIYIFGEIFLQKSVEKQIELSDSKSK